MTTQELIGGAVERAAIPLAETLARVSALNTHLGARLLPGLEPGWRLVGELLSADEPRWLDELLDGVMARYGVAERRTAAILFMGSYAWYASAAAIASYLTERRVPILAPDQVAVRFGVTNDEQRVQIALLAHGFAALRDDPAGAYPATVTLVESQEALRELLRDQIEAHMAAVIDYVTRHTRLGRRAQWNLLADACAEICLWTGRQVGAQEQACAEGLALIKGPGSPMRPSKTTYLTLSAGARCETVRLRGSCCMYYKVPGGSNCNTCPLLQPDEREEKLMAWLQATAQGA